MGFDEPVEIDGGWMTGTNDKSTLEIVQWISPYDGAEPYPVPINHLGIGRMAFATADIEADVATLKAQGVKFVSPITPCCSGNDSSSSIVAFYDPDGTIMELAGFPGMDKLFPILQFFAD
jgi:catechol 2,3-dioxygenase-like lactoylglutathione lyase family enzyme